MKNDIFGDRMKTYEGLETNKVLMPNLPVCVRLDGKSFHSYTRGMNRPYDERMSNLMINTTKKLVELYNANIGYTQSDEITLIFEPPTIMKNFLFGGRIFKLISILASTASAYFNREAIKIFPDKGIAIFDCRVWNVPDLIEAANVLQWREFDATKNSISMAASSYYSCKELLHKNSAEKQELLFKKGINWNNYPVFFKRGTYVKRVTFSTKFSPEEIEKLPLKHNARINPNMEFARTEVKVFDMPIFASIANKVGVIFNNEKPIINKKEQ